MNIAGIVAPAGCGEGMCALSPAIGAPLIAAVYPNRRPIGHRRGQRRGVTLELGIRVHWLAAHPRFHLHFTPTSASWLNLVERWFGLITSQAIRRGSFDSVRRLERTITRWLTHWNEIAKPFRWTRSAADIKRSIANVTAIYEI